MSDQVDPCNTITIWPVLYSNDWQALSIGGTTNWKERVVHTYTEVAVDLWFSERWINSVYLKWLTDVNASVNSAAILSLAWRCSLVIYDEDELVTAAPSLFHGDFFETESYVPGTFRQGVFWQPGLIGTQMNEVQKIRIKSKARRRLETGKLLGFQFELGCADFVGNIAGGPGDAWIAWGPPVRGLGHFRSAYLE